MLYTITKNTDGTIRGYDSLPDFSIIEAPENGIIQSFNCFKDWARALSEFCIIVQAPVIEKTPEEKFQELVGQLNATKESKLKAIKDLRDYEESRPTPKSDSTTTYEINGEYVTFSISLSECTLISAIIQYLKNRTCEQEPTPTRSWGDINGNRHRLTSNDFTKLLNHLLVRDEQQFDFYRKRKEAILALSSLERLDSEDITVEEMIEEVKSYDITQVYV